MFFFMLCYGFPIDFPDFLHRPQALPLFAPQNLGVFLPPVCATLSPRAEPLLRLVSLAGHGLATSARADYPWEQLSGGGLPLRSWDAGLTQRLSDRFRPETIHKRNPLPISESHLRQWIFHPELLQGMALARARLARLVRSNHALGLRPRPKPSKDLGGSRRVK